MRRVCVAGLLVIAGCGAPGSVADPIPFALDPRGIQLLDRSQRVDFGRTDHSTQAAMKKLAASGPLSEGNCIEGGSFATYPGDVVLHFASGNFVGWSRGETDGTIQQAGRACSKV